MCVELLCVFFASKSFETILKEDYVKQAWDRTIMSILLHLVVFVKLLVNKKRFDMVA